MAFMGIAGGPDCVGGGGGYVGIPCRERVWSVLGCRASLAVYCVGWRTVG